jgi:anaerobic magnesium-protoporphyrin IX monomethyl ester cyclase
LRILLLNPPGKQQFLRDYYCSTVSKAGYLWHPIDLLIQSGFLQRVGELFFLDAIAERLSIPRALKKIDGIHPEVVLSLVGAQSLKEDMDFLSKVAGRCQSRIAVSGEPVLEEPEKLLELAPWLSAIVRDFATDELASWVKEGAPRRPQIMLGGASNRTLSYPLPRHTMFLSPRYRVPFDGGKMYASVLSAFGCPYQCRYCNSGKNSICYTRRELDELFEELAAIERLEKVHHLFFRDMTFTAHRQRVAGICEGLLRCGYRFTWNCYARPDNLDPELCRLMARAGCRLVQMGVETFDPEVLRSQGRSMPIDRIQKAFRMVRQSGMFSGAHFLLGLPGDTQESLQATIEKAIAISPDYVSFNILQRRYGCAVGEDQYPSNHEVQVFDRLRRSAYRRFYLRIGYLWNLLTGVRSGRDLRSLARCAVVLAWRSIAGEKPHRRR